MYLPYPSSREPDLTLYAEFAVPSEPRPLLLSMHGWHGKVKQAHADNVTPTTDPAWFVVAPEMRGRGDAGGRPDCNGWELQDAVDALAFARSRFADRILEPELATLAGGSGGGGNAFALVGKFPDTFCRAKAECGISDYALWYRNDEVGEFRDEMDVWIGRSPDADPEAYASRSGLTTVGNLLTPLVVFHGELDIRVPCEHSRRFTEAACRAGKGSLVAYHELKGVGGRSHYGSISPEQEAFRVREGQAFLQRDRRPVSLPRRGRLVVAGYLKTAAFDVVLESIDRVGEIEYDLDRGAFALAAGRPLAALLTVRDPACAAPERRLEATSTCRPRP